MVRSMSLDMATTRQQRSDYSKVNLSKRWMAVSKRIIVSMERVNISKSIENLDTPKRKYLDPSTA